MKYVFNQKVYLLPNDLFVIKFVVFIGSLIDRTFVDRFAFTIGSLQFYPRSWMSIDVWSAIPHEVQHSIQMKKLGFNVPVIGTFFGTIIFMILYFLLLPFWFNWFRYVFEKDAVVSDVVYLYKNKMITNSEALFDLEYGARMISSKYYGYAWRYKSAIVSYYKEFKSRTLEENANE